VVFFDRRIKLVSSCSTRKINWGIHRDSLAAYRPTSSEQCIEERERERESPTYLGFCTVVGFILVHKRDKQVDHRCVFCPYKVGQLEDGGGGGRRGSGQTMQLFQA
jgi:hypothetical protein